jgi:hypothetical protein
MAKRKPTSKHSKKQVGIPRTYKVARAIGHAKAKHTFTDLSEDSKRNFVQFSEFGARAGSVCGVGPSPDPNYWLVCYKDERGRCNWVSVPRTSITVHA